jgi:hypothetical protein
VSLLLKFNLTLKPTIPQCQIWCFYPDLHDFLLKSPSAVGPAILAVGLSMRFVIQDGGYGSHLGFGFSLLVGFS